MAKPSSETLQTADTEWMAFPGGELEGKRPRVLCPPCRALLKRAVAQAVRPALAARGESPAAFEQRCIPPGDVAPLSNIPDILGRRALPAGRLAVLGATPDFHHGLPAGLKPICFQCYRAELERDRSLRAAGQLDTASDARFQCTLPFDPVNTVRLATLKAERAAERQARGRPASLSIAPPPGMRQAIVSPAGVSQAIVPPAGVSQAIVRCADRRRQAQIAARHALRAIGDGLRTQRLREGTSGRTVSEHATVAAIDAAELQLPESWLPFVLPRAAANGSLGS
jgi:hypothetical protein